MLARAWSPNEVFHHINYFEMLAVYFALKAFQAPLEGKHVGVMIDNTTADTTLARVTQRHVITWPAKYGTGALTLKLLQYSRCLYITMAIVFILRFPSFQSHSIGS